MASHILDRARRIILDETSVRWPLVELCMWLNDGQREIVLHKPSASSENRVIPLLAGTWQQIPDDALSLLRIVRNITAVGDAPNHLRTGGSAIRIVSRDILDAQHRDWHDSNVLPFKQAVKHYIYDEEDTRSFYVYPGNTGTGKIEAVLSTVPAAIAVAEDDEPEEIASYEINLSLPDIYISALVDFVCYRAYSKDSTYAGNGQRATLHYQQFATSVGIKLNKEMLNSPNRSPGIKSEATGPV
ncbi:hypothetical protein LWE61_15000 [Sphingobium sufflavum]|uniref:phage adaptor protein n=1 Tax=Sphingobium sufflavum TaxID=1129547 RepID=UPI001F3D9738|nr:DUF6682 family protein [Sphingobium sufflavum]MCE7797858.1 hypothetical protein [Sphingobium sufflavum]